MELTVQTRNENGELRYFSSITDAFEYANHEADVWKISFDDSNGKRIRLTRREVNGLILWEYSPITAEIAELVRRVGGNPSEL